MREATPQTPNTGGPAASMVVLPLRLFLGFSFIAASLYKLMDPEFFDPGKAGYIGTQIQGFAQGSPIGGFLSTVAEPNAMLFGIMVVAGEMAIGLATVFGLFSRLAAIFGMLLSLTFWLSATWQVQPFFYGADLPFAVGWLVLALANPHPVLSLDGLIERQQSQQNGSSTATTVRPDRRRFITVAGATLATGVATAIAWDNTFNAKPLAAPAPSAATNPAPAPSAGVQSAPATPTPPATQAPALASPSPTPAAQPTFPAAQPTPTPAPQQSGPVIATLKSLPTGSAVKFVTPDTNQRAILIHEDDGSVKAFSSICTHEGCEVNYSSSAQMLICPCHGAAYDIKTGDVLRRPARRPLDSYPIQVDANGNVHFLTDGTSS